MKKYKNYLICWAVILLWLLIYFLIPHVKFWTLYWLDNAEKDRFHVVEEGNYRIDYQIYKATLRSKKVDDYIVDRMMLDRVKVYQEKSGYVERRNFFLKDLGLEYYYNRYIEKWDKRIFEEIDKAIQKPHN